MPKIANPTIEDWKARANGWLASQGLNRRNIATGLDAWTVAHNCKFTREAYADPSIADAHIQTALETVFPNAVFKDAKRY